MKSSSYSEFMKSLFFLAAFLLSFSSGGGEQRRELKMDLDEVFVVSDTDEWKVEVRSALSLRYANVEVSPKKGSDFGLMLYFKCDSEDLARYNSIGKMERDVIRSCRELLPATVEKEPKLRRLKVNGWYGCCTVLTDGKLASQPKVPEGEFKYITRGMVRLAPNSALAFSLMTNETNSPLYGKLFGYIESFVKPKQ